MGNENCIDWLTGDTVISLSITQERIRNRLVKLAAENPEEVGITRNRDGSIFAHVPLSWLWIRPPVKRNLTDEQRERQRERLARVKHGTKEAVTAQNEQGG